MNTRNNAKVRALTVIAAGILLGTACGAVSAQALGGLGGKLGDMLGGNNMSSGSIGNVAGLLQYCVKNNYLSGDSGASGLAGKLLGKTDGGAGNADYQSGLSGILKGNNGKTTDLSNVGGGNSDLKSKITTKACDIVLKQGQKFLGH